MPQCAATAVDRLENSRNDMSRAFGDVCVLVVGDAIATLSGLTRDRRPRPGPQLVRDPPACAGALLASRGASLGGPPVDAVGQALEGDR